MHKAVNNSMLACEKLRTKCTNKINWVANTNALKRKTEASFIHQSFGGKLISKILSLHIIFVVLLASSSANASLSLIQDIWASHVFPSFYKVQSNLAATFIMNSYFHFLVQQC